MPEKPHGLPRERRLLRRRDFTHLSRAGTRGSAGPLVVLARKARGQGRVGFTVPKQVGNAVERNLVKRRLRHLMRTRKDAWRGADVVVIAREGAAALGFDELAQKLDAALKRALAELSRGKKSAPPRRGKPAATT